MADNPNQLDALVHSVVEGLGYELWGYEYRAHKYSALLRVFIEKEGGINLDDCSNVSRQLGAALDVDDPIKVAYTLEVSSPGIDRVLFKPEQFNRYIGRRVKIRAKWPIDGQRNFVGRLDGIKDECVMVEMDSKDFSIPVDAIDRARLRADDQASADSETVSDE